MIGDIDTAHCSIATVLWRWRRLHYCWASVLGIYNRVLSVQHAPATFPLGRLVVKRVRDAPLARVRHESNMIDCRTFQHRTHYVSGEIFYALHNTLSPI